MHNIKQYFISDLHFGHDNVINFDNRPWDTVEEMNEEMIKRWNSKVTKEDHVYVLGDLIWKGDAVNIVNQLNGNIHLILGNHDRIKNAQYKKRFDEICDYKKMKVTLEDGTEKIVILSHYPIMLYEGHFYGSIMLYGHVHNTYEEKITQKWIQELHDEGIRCEMHNIGACHQDYYPMTLDEILAKNKK